MRLATKWQVIIGQRVVELESSHLDDVLKCGFGGIK